MIECIRDRKDKRQTEEREREREREREKEREREICLCCGTSMTEDKEKTNKRRSEIVRRNQRLKCFRHRERTIWTSEMSS